ncbi:hypothetical protein DITRI_Ditri16bG0062400 [Diplodiscus trichospermus]
MMVPIEALAMAGVDYNEWGLDIEKWEDDNSERPPQHLLADEEEEEPERFTEHGTEISDACSLTHPSEDFDGNCDDNASNGAIGECCRHRRVSEGRTLVARIRRSWWSVKLMMIRYMIILLLIARIVWEEEIS